MNDFSILVHRSGQSLHLKLLGELDQLSVNKIIDTIKGNQLGIDRVFLHTNGLSKVRMSNPQELLAQIPRLVKGAIRIFFTGDYSPPASSQGSEPHKGLNYLKGYAT